MLSQRGWLAIVATVIVVLAVVVIALWTASGKGITPADEDEEDRIVRRGPPPKVLFGPDAHSGNAELDAFVEHFITICLEGKYEKYRLCWTAYADPISRTRFQAAWNKVSEVVIKRISPAPADIKARRPAYIVAATVYLRPPAKVEQKDVYVLVQREGDRWAVAPAPKRQPAPTDESRAIPIAEP